jgi:hypothetical protein
LASNGRAVAKAGPKVAGSRVINLGQRLATEEHPDFAPSLIINACLRPIYCLYLIVLQKLLF